MRMFSGFKNGVAGFAAVIWIVSLHAYAADNTAPGCKPDGNQTELNSCAHDKFARQDAELNKLYKDKLGSLQTAQTRVRFKDAQKAWLVYRDKSCLYEAREQSESGSIWPLEQYSCLANMTEQRIQILKRYIACTENGCPN